jgi:hypothetical protein
MSALGQKRTLVATCSRSALLSKADNSERLARVFSSPALASLDRQQFLILLNALQNAHQLRIRIDAPGKADR